MVGKVIVKWAGGYDPALGRAVKDPSLEPRGGRRKRADVPPEPVSLTATDKSSEERKAE